MDWYSLIFELIDMRSFSNLWFWIALAVMWSTTSHRVLGVPFDMIQRAARHGGEAQADLEDMVRVNTNRILYIAGVSGIWILAIASAILTSLAIMAFYYGVEFAQAVFLLAMPMTFVGLMSINTAKLIRDNALEGPMLRRQLVRHRLWTQMMGVMAIFVTAMWGMYQNLSQSSLIG